MPPSAFAEAAARCLARTEQDGECLVWKGAVNSTGTAMAAVQGVVMPVGRIVWHAAHGEFPPFKLSRTCGNTLCINADHLTSPAPIGVDERLWEKVDVFGPAHPYDPTLGRCWLWSGYCDPAGYGRLQAPGFGNYAHRAAYGIANGCIPKLFVLHSCDRPACCNPAHLREGTQADNVADREARGRGRRPNQKETAR